MPDPATNPAEVTPLAADFELKTVDDKPVKLSTFKNKVVVLVFGSYSCPSFRQRAAGLEKLRKAMGGRVNILIVYTKESHPIEDWDTARNKSDGVQVEQPTTPAARKALALEAKTSLGLTTPILLDTMDNKTAADYSAGANSAAVIGRDGRIFARQEWFEPTALRRKIELALRPAPTTRP